MTDVSALMEKYIHTKEHYEIAQKNRMCSVPNYDGAIDWAVEFHLVLCEMLLHKEVMESYFNLTLMDSCKEVILTYFELVNNRDQNLFKLKVMNAMLRR